MSKRYEKDFSKPAGRLEFGADVFIPFVVSVVTGVLCGSLAALLNVAGGGGRVFAVGAVSVALVVWCWLLLDDERRVVWQTERIFQTDVDGAPVPVPERPVVRVEVEAGQTLHLVDFHGLGSVGELQTFARLALEGRLSERELKRELDMLRPQWQALRDDLMARQFLVWNNARHKRQGVALTRRGADVLEGVLNGSELLLTDVGGDGSLDA